MNRAERRRQRQHAQPAVGPRIPGGCDDCDAYQVLGEERPNVWLMRIHHDASCPWLQGVTQ